MPFQQENISVLKPSKFTMSSVASCPDRQDHSLYKKPLVHRRNNSGELDVFEAAKYFSSVSNISHDQLSVSSQKSNKNNLTTKSCKEYDQAWRPKGARMSLDALGRPSKLKIPEPMQSGYKVHGDDKMNKNKIKQPSSPGGRLASFLNSLFNNSSSSKKKKKPMQDDPRPRMRRSSISHVDSSRSMYLSTASITATGFRTPPPVYKTFFDDTKSLQDHKRITPSLPEQIGIESRAKSSTGLDHKAHINNVSSLSAFDKVERKSANGVCEKEKDLGDKKIEFEFKKAEKIIVKHFEYKKHVKDDEEEEGYQSDTSSDLFELQNYDLGEFQNGLPVYESTNVEQIKNSAKPDNK